ncbi:MerR family transcriptional regulator [Bacillus sp. SM2101]|uniref:MerR family transcriptional regulator n=1 Tax=Bacillus sp. SM2101 TaxID=2805366 RepID=UPI001BDF1F01|nr:MerR family transcriptional regulator [Bacillus sp. SM2101]
MTGDHRIRIGKFAESHQVSIDTVRHYMKLGLIVPEKRGGHYIFDKRCNDDFERVLILKEIGFSLKEIQSLQRAYRFFKGSKLEKEMYKEQLLQKKEDFENQIESLTRNKDKLEEQLRILDEERNQQNYSNQMGIHLSYLSFFCCPLCQGDLILTEGQVIQHQIINGWLSCECEEQYEIKDGILLVNNENKTEEEIVNDELIVDYLNETNPEVLDAVNKGNELLYKNVSIQDWEGKVVLDVGSGTGIFLRLFYNDIPQDTLYIAVDHDFKVHKYLKEHLESLNIRKKVIFVCADYLKLPLKSGVTDILVDYFGVTNYSLANDSYILPMLDKYTNNQTILIGTSIIYHRFGINNIIPPQRRNLFQKEFLMSSMHELGYKVEFENESKYPTSSSKYKYEQLVSENDIATYFTYIGKR